ncbi:MAG: c-type cytochrome [Actinomycetia bacterium]|nr:c-type cytochrome [Actinomycetes bacterium]
MLVHFPIALLFTAWVLDVWTYRRANLLREQTGLLILTLGLLSLGATIVAGAIAAHEVLVTATTAPLLAAHEHAAMLTAILVLGATIGRYRARALWRRQAPLTQVTLAAPRRPMTAATRRAWRWALAAELASFAAITVTGTLGGQMVYDHGLGVAVTTASPRPAAQVSLAGPRRPGSGSTRPGAATADVSATISAGQQIWQTTCAACHGSPPPFTAAFVTRMGARSLITFISQRMPPSQPVTPHQAQQIVTYLQAQSP